MPKTYRERQAELKKWARKVERWAMMGVPHRVVCRWLVKHAEPTNLAEADEFLREIDTYLDNH